MSTDHSQTTCRIYVASPLGFSEPGRLFNRDILLPTLAQAGFSPFDPWACATLNNPDGPTIGECNHRAIDDSQAMLCWLDGQEVDSGTCAEIGYAAAKGLYIVGVRDDLRLSGEGFGVVNLQVEYFVNLTGGAIVKDLTSGVERLRTWWSTQS